MEGAFRYVKISTAVILLLVVGLNFAGDLKIQNQDGILDGPLSWPLLWAFAMNKLVLAILLSAILIADFEIKISQKSKFWVRIFSALCIVLSLIGFGFLIQQNHETGFYWDFSELYFIQLGLFLISVTLFDQAREKEA